MSRDSHLGLPARCMADMFYVWVQTPSCAWIGLDVAFEGAVGMWRSRTSLVLRLRVLLAF